MRTVPETVNTAGSKFYRFHWTSKCEKAFNFRGKAPLAPFSYARRAILWSNFMVPFNGAILWHVCTGLNHELSNVYFILKTASHQYPSSEMKI